MQSLLPVRFLAFFQFSCISLWYAMQNCCSQHSNPIVVFASDTTIPKRGSTQRIALNIEMQSTLISLDLSFDGCLLQEKGLKIGIRERNTNKSILSITFLTVFFFSTNVLFFSFYREKIWSLSCNHQQEKKRKSFSMVCSY